MKYTKSKFVRWLVPVMFFCFCQKGILPLPEDSRSGKLNDACCSVVNTCCCVSPGSLAAGKCNCFAESFVPSTGKSFVMISGNCMPPGNTAHIPVWGSSFFNIEYSPNVQQFYSSHDNKYSLSQLLNTITFVFEIDKPPEFFA